MITLGLGGALITSGLGSGERILIPSGFKRMVVVPGERRTLAIDADPRIIGIPPEGRREVVVWP